MRDSTFIDDPEQWGEIVVDLAISNVKKGGLPFSAIIVNQGGQVIGKGVNQVAAHLDCTAHAEIQAIRNASMNEKSISLRGAALIASGEPCALCYMVILMAEIRNVVILADRQEIKKYGFDYLWTYEYFNSSSLREITVMNLDSEKRMLPFELYKVSLNEPSL